ncbi:MAG: hypothetical protein HDR72_02895 [Ruminococcaceae bacterium]|nr:hypothetical protein [Oscillospiraceae bacterium]
MDNAAKKPTVPWHKLTLMTLLGVLTLCWLFYFVTGLTTRSGLRDALFICGLAVMVCSTALILTLIPIIFIRPLSGGTGAKVLRVMGRCALFLALAAATSFQCIFGIVCFMGYGV